MKTFIFKPFVLCLILSCAVFSSCNKEDVDVKTDIEYTPLEFNSATKSFISSNNLFSYKLFQELLTESSNTESLLVSPLSCAIELGMLTESNNPGYIITDNILSMLGFEKGSREDIQNYCHSVMNDLPSLSKTTKYQTANLLVSNTSKGDLDVDFKHNVAEYYGTHVESLPFDNPQTVARYINNWAKENTNSIIDKVIDPGYIRPEWPCLLSNALYFYGYWTYPFDKSHTFDSRFKLENGETVSVKMMKRNDFSDALFSFGKSSCYTRLSLPYGNGAFCMDIYLPEDGYGVIDVAACLADDANRQKEQSSYVSLFDLQIPKFNIKGYAELTGPINKLSNYALGSVAIYQAISLTNDEKGTETASVTQSGFVSSPRSIKFIADHPFVFTIRSNGIVLFVGVYNGDKQQ